MSSKQFIPPKVAGLCGILGPIIGFASIGLAVYCASWFSWTENWLSDLGGTPGERPIWSARGTASVIFNVGLLLAGILGIIFATAVRKIRMLDTPLGRIGTLLFLLDMFALCAIGIFPESTGTPHSVVSFIFFLLIPLSLLPIGSTIRKTSEKNLGLYVTLLGAMSLCLSPLLYISRPWGGNAIAEMFPCILTSMFSIVFGIGLLRDKFEFED